MIPKVFHLTYKTVDIPDYFQHNLNQIKTYYPEYQIIIHDDNAIKAFVTQNFADYYESTFQKMPEFIMQVDTVRYMWMYVYGGIYCDFDIYFLKPLALEKGAIFIEREWTYPDDSSITHSVHNCCFASEQGHPIWLDILDGIASNVKAFNSTAPIRKLYSLVEKLRRVQNRLSPVFNLTGPNAISKIITERNLLEKYSDVTVLPGSILYQNGFSRSTIDTAYVVHQTTGSWR